MINDGPEIEGFDPGAYSVYAKYGDAFDRALQIFQLEELATAVLIYSHNTFIVIKRDGVHSKT